MQRDAILCNDMTMLAYEGVRYFPVYEPRTYTFPRGFGTLGSAMPTALGAKVGCPRQQVVSTTGDGGFQFTLEELGAAAHHQHPDRNGDLQRRDAYRRQSRPAPRLLASAMSRSIW